MSSACQPQLWRYYLCKWIESTCCVRIEQVLCVVQSGHAGLDCGHTAGVGGHLLGHYLHSPQKAQLPEALSLGRDPSWVAAHMAVRRFNVLS